MRCWIHVKPVSSGDDVPAPHEGHGSSLCLGGVWLPRPIFNEERFRLSKSRNGKTWQKRYLHKSSDR